jgi:hypothetical protein
MTCIRNPQGPEQLRDLFEVLAGWRNTNLESKITGLSARILMQQS